MAEHSTLLQIALAADRLSDCLNEFPDDPTCCGEWLQRLDDLLSGPETRTLLDAAKYGAAPASPPATAAEGVAQQIYALLADRFAEMIRFHITKHGLPESLASADVSAALRKTADDIAALTAAGQGAAPGEPDEHSTARMIPPLPGLKGRRYFAEDSDGNWFYINHANTWQGCPPIAGHPSQEAPGDE
jgi:hypothetical protein